MIVCQKERKPRWIELEIEQRRWGVMTRYAGCGLAADVVMAGSIGVHAHGHARVVGTDKGRFWLCRGGLDLDLFGGSRGGVFGSVDRGAEVSVAVDEETIGLLCLCLDTCLGHAGLVEGDLSASLDLLDALHGVEGGGDELAVVANGDVALLFEFEGGVDGHLLAIRLAEGLCPANLSWVALQLEVLVTLGFAELEDLCVVTDKGDTLARVARGGAEEAMFDPHGESISVRTREMWSVLDG